MGKAKLQEGINVLSFLSSCPYSLGRAVAEPRAARGQGSVHRGGAKAAEFHGMHGRDPERVAVCAREPNLSEPGMAHDEEATPGSGPSSGPAQGSRPRRG